MANDDPYFVRVERALDRLEIAVTGVEERLSHYHQVAGRHTQLRGEVEAAIAELDQLMGKEDG